MGILSGIVSYLFGLSLNLMDAAINGFLGALGFDLDTFEQYFPAASQFHDIIVGFAVALLFIMLVFQIFRNFGVVLDMEAEDPLKMLGKTALFLGMIVCSRSIINLILGLMADPYNIFLDTAAAPYQFELTTLVTAMFNSVFSNPFMNIVAMILMLVMGWQFLKLTVECVERYIVFYFALYCAPVVFATGAFKSTAQIFKSWCRLVGSQAMLLLINVWSIKLFLSFMPVFESSGSDMIFTFLMGYAFLKFAQKADTLLRILGLNTASTGDMVRSLGGTIASIAMAVRSVGGMAKGVASAVGQRFSGSDGANSNGKGTGGSGGGNRGGPGDEISGMGGRKGDQSNPGGSPGPDTAEPANPGGVTMSGISAAKQGYVTDVMRAARVRMEGGPFTSGESAGQPGQPLGESSQEGTQPQNTDAESRDGNIPLGQVENVDKAAAQTTSVKGFQSLDEETLEGLSNLAHGLPHDKYDAETKQFSGGGFPEFTGEEANIIGASQLTPAEGVERSTLKRADGTTGTIYRNSETGEAHMVQFSSVDNGVMQGSISRIDPETGHVGEGMAFKAVHSSVPGAETFSAHSVPVRDPSGGTYHVATDADTAIFSSVKDTPQVIASAYSPGGASRMAAADGAGTASTFEAVGGTDAPGAAAAMGANTVESFHTQAVNSTTVTPPSAGAAPIPSPAVSGESISRVEVRQETSIHGETPLPTQHSADAPPISTGMQPPQNQIRRFSRNNPANLEVFRRDDGRIEAFDKQAPDSEPGPGVTPPKNN